MGSDGTRPDATTLPGGGGGRSTCSPGKMCGSSSSAVNDHQNMYKCSPLCDKANHFQNHYEGQSLSLVTPRDFVMPPGGLTMKNTKLLSSGLPEDRGEGHIVISIPGLQEFEGSNNVPILNSILTTSSLSGSRNQEDCHNNCSAEKSGGGGGGGNPGTSTLKKRVQIQEVTV